MRAPIGLKIRNQRKSLGYSQSNFAKMLGISPSYLNLIEANKRDVGGTLLQTIAHKLDIALDELTGENEQRLLSALEEIFTDPALESLKMGANEARELVATNPRAARALHQTYRAFAEAVAEADAYSNRLKSDPLLADLLHQMLSQITAVRSSAEILTDVPDLDASEQQRFHGMVSRESRALSDVAQTLIDQFEGEAGRNRSLTPARELDDLIVEEKNYFPTLEETAANLRDGFVNRGSVVEVDLAAQLRAEFGIETKRVAQLARSETGFPMQYRYDAKEKVLWFQGSATLATRQFQLARLYGELKARQQLMDLANDERLSTPASRRLAVRALGSYLAGALIFPYEDFLHEAEQSSYDIDYLSQRYAASFEQVAHRLVTLRRPGAEGIPFGFLRADPSGRLSKHFPLPGMAWPNAGHGCPLWTLFDAFRHPNEVVRQTVSYPDGGRYLMLAKSFAKRADRFQSRPLYTSVMLVCDVLYADQTVYGNGMSLDNPQVDVPVGPTCRMCIRRSCESRQEEMFTGAGGVHTVRLPLTEMNFDIGER